MDAKLGKLTTKHNFGDINFGKFECLYCYVFNIKQGVLAQETLASLR